MRQSQQPNLATRKGCSYGWPYSREAVDAVPWEEQEGASKWMEETVSIVAQYDLGFHKPDIFPCSHGGSMRCLLAEYFKDSTEVEETMEPVGEGSKSHG